MCVNKRRDVRNDVLLMFDAHSNAADDGPRVQLIAVRKAMMRSVLQFDHP